MSVADIKFRCYKDLYIKDSLIAGKGLFCRRNINIGDVILSFGGMLASIEDRYSGKYLSSTFAGVSENVLICEEYSSEKDYSDYLNHSCDPNVGMDDCLTVVAIKNIPANVELVIDYAFFEADRNWKLKTLCNCGNACCRKLITGDDWRQFKPTDKLFYYFSPFIRRRIMQNG